MAAWSGELRARSKALCADATEQCAQARANVSAASQTLWSIHAQRTPERGGVRSVAAVLQAGRRHTGMSLGDLWAAYVALGGTVSEAGLSEFLTGGRLPTPSQFNIVAQAINERFGELGHDHPFPYAEDL
jgi:hypothetical protein